MKRRKIIFICVILAFVFVAVSICSIIYTERPKFCISCHIMKPYYTSWKESAHKDVNCLECHYEPGLRAHVMGKINGLVQVAQYITHRYSERPNAQISDASCLRSGCHSKEDLKNKKISFKDKVNFAHNEHFSTLRGDIQLRCTSCHMQLTSDKHITVEKSVCFICHFKNIPQEQLSLKCLTCHAGIQDTKAHQEYLVSGSKCIECHNDAKKGDGEVKSQTCYLCHAQKETIEKIKDYQLLHKIHVKENKVDCISCHEIIEHN